MNWITKTRRLLAVLLLAVWWGGFTFYALVVVPTGHQVLHSKVRQGFITQAVTNKLNVLGVVTLTLLLWQWVATRREAGSPGWSRTAGVSWLVLAASLAALCWLHPRLDTLLDAGQRSVLDDDKFYALHRIYLVVATVQWLAGAVHFISLLSGQRRHDGRIG